MYSAMQMDGEFVGAELKKSYMDVAISNLNGISNSSQLGLF